MNFICQEYPATVDFKLKVHYTVLDCTGRTTVVFGNKMAYEIFGKTACEMQQVLNMQGCGYDFPGELDMLVGKTLLLKIKLKQRNLEYPDSSMYVHAYCQVADMVIENFIPMKDLGCGNFQDQVTPKSQYEMEKENIQLEEMHAIQWAPRVKYSNKREKGGNKRRRQRMKYLHELYVVRVNNACMTMKPEKPLNQERM
ncbi:uncharacterized protein LOC114734276 isoform X1 [Neltuma alba]|uniref:uncharacterized protein LOC114734276 isoform X1 n=1 Tax=Neltuma alba TaxID=207710 RepID=UPI0010A39698|nr:uncharacterized protein LOC114734276 isoform X1 [Prosopis alba]